MSYISPQRDTFENYEILEIIKFQILIKTGSDFLIQDSEFYTREDAENYIKERTK